MSDDLSPEQRIRDRALFHAVGLEHELPHPLTFRNDDLSSGDEYTKADAAVLNERIGMTEQATVDRLLRHARLFAEYIRTGFDGELELDGLTATAEPPSWPSGHPDRHGGG